MKVYQNVCEMIGNTPIIKLNKIEEKLKIKNQIFAKIEKINPGGSIKDRVAYEMINDAYEKGLINKDTIIIEATSGNTGIGLAMVCAYYKLKLIIVMPRGVSKERIKILKAYGAKIILTKKSLGVKGSIEKIKYLQKKYSNYYFIDQFSNESNYMSHYKNTAYELYNDLDGDIDFVFVGMGSSGTITGIAKMLKEKNPKTKIIGIEPEESPYYSKQIIGKCRIPGIGTTFIPEITDFTLIDDIVLVKSEIAKKYKEMLALEEGLLVGYSSGATLAGAIEYLNKYRIENKKIALIFPDGGERYLSSL